MGHDFPTALNDQLPLNAARCALGVPLNFLDRRYKWLGFGASSPVARRAGGAGSPARPDRQDFNRAYFKGQYQLFEPTLRLDGAAAAQLATRRGSGFCPHATLNLATAVRVASDKEAGCEIGD